MIPYKDDNPTAIVPFVTIGLIAVNCAVFIWQMISPLGMHQIVMSYGAIPANIIKLSSNQPISPVATVFAAMFMHGGIFHIAGNMLYLWIFGNNIEDALGHFRYLLFYLFSGIVAAYAHAMTAADSTIPMIGASGAVSGILGAYLLLFPTAKVYSIVFIGFIIQRVALPAVFVLGFWIVIQIINGSVIVNSDSGGVAWFAHIGGFAAGLITIKLWLLGRNFKKLRKKQYFKE
ncbi:MAG: rhomboid family intramembrane serine protease [Dissulfurispiraceae bacterium]|jgi:membrane associated rhomboid family serine protease|nr:rhomboid family intramembrane serine protease [Dissulfurispiraceae bacterium]